MADKLVATETASAMKLQVAPEGNTVAAVTKSGGGKGAAKKKPASGGKRTGSSSGGGGANPSRKLTDGKCHIHSKFGADAYTCDPPVCKMKGQVKPKLKIAEIGNDD